MQGTPFINQDSNENSQLTECSLWYHSSFDQKGEFTYFKHKAYFKGYWPLYTTAEAGSTAHVHLLFPCLVLEP